MGNLTSVVRGYLRRGHLGAISSQHSQRNGCTVQTKAVWVKNMLQWPSVSRMALCFPLTELPLTPDGGLAVGQALC